MGYYIEVPHVTDKARQILDMPAAKAELQHLPKYVDPSTGRITVCVVQNRFFEAAGLMYSRDEFDAFMEPDARPRTWLTVDLDWARKEVPDLEFVLRRRAQRSAA